VNPWDLNEPDPMTTGRWGRSRRRHRVQRRRDKAIVHFRNQDTRLGKALKAAPTATPARLRLRADVGRCLPALATIQANPSPWGCRWTSIGVSGFKKGDRVPPGGTFTYTWQTFGWPTTAGVWLYHDHSICDMENVQQGAIGIGVIRIRRTRRTTTNLDLPVDR